MKESKTCIEVFKISIFSIFAMALMCCFLKLKIGERQENEKIFEGQNKEEVSLGEESFLILNESTGKVEEVSGYEYALGAVMAEMPPYFHKEALKAQSLSALTRARYLKEKYEKGTGKYKNAHFSQNPDFNEGFVREENAEKIYGKNAPAYMEKMKETAQYACRRTLTYEGKPLLASYHAMSAGFTESSQNVWGSSLPYLVPAESSGDCLSPLFETEKTFKTDELKKIMESSLKDGNFKEGDEENWFKVLTRSKGGYVLKILAGGTETEGTALRKILNLRSACFYIEPGKEIFTFKVRGYGHGVGLSQEGADFYARQGKDAEWILEHYYRGARVNLIK